MNISVIGSGNVAILLSKALLNADHKIDGIYMRNIKSFDRIPRLQTHVKSLYSQKIDSDIVIIAVSDDVIKEVAAGIEVSPNAIVVHTSGTVPSTVLQRFNNFGVFYPLQTIHKDKSWNELEVPILTYSPDISVESKIFSLGKTISNQVHKIDDVQRERIHIAAVMVNNFTNYIVSEAYQYLDNYNIDQTILYPLIRQTTNKLTAQVPDLTQTGPAKRGDVNTINKHLELLSDDEEIKALYSLISTQIMNKFKSK